MFNAFHKDFDRVRKYAKLYQIGLIDSNDESSSGRSEEERLKIQKELEIKEDFKKIHKIAEEKVIKFLLNFKSL